MLAAARSPSSTPPSRDFASERSPAHQFVHIEAQPAACPTAPLRSVPTAPVPPQGGPPRPLSSLSTGDERPTRPDQRARRRRTVSHHSGARLTSWHDRGGQTRLRRSPRTLDPRRGTSAGAPTTSSEEGRRSPHRADCARGRRRARSARRVRALRGRRLDHPHRCVLSRAHPGQVLPLTRANGSLNARQAARPQRPDPAHAKLAHSVPLSRAAQHLCARLPAANSQVHECRGVLSLDLAALRRQGCAPCSLSSRRPRSLR